MRAGRWRRPQSWRACDLERSIRTSAATAPACTRAIRATIAAACRRTSAAAVRPCASTSRVRITSAALQDLGRARCEGCRVVDRVIVCQNVFIFEIEGTPLVICEVFRSGLARRFLSRFRKKLSATARARADGAKSTTSHQIQKANEGNIDSMNFLRRT